MWHTAWTPFWRAGGFTVLLDNVVLPAVHSNMGAIDCGAPLCVGGPHHCSSLLECTP